MLPLFSIMTLYEHAQWRSNEIHFVTFFIFSIQVAEQIQEDIVLQLIVFLSLDVLADPVTRRIQSLFEMLWSKKKKWLKKNKNKIKSACREKKLL